MEISDSLYKRLSKQYDEFLQHAPPYAKAQVLEAINKVRDLEEKRVFRQGVYYIVLIDLCGSTIASDKLGSDLNKQRIEEFILGTVEALNCVSDLDNHCGFLKEIGDAALFMFSSFNDIYSWRREVDRKFTSKNRKWQKQLTAEEFKYFEVKSKTIVHAGEIYFDQSNNPLSLAVNQIFKIEKMFEPSEIGITDTVKTIAGPKITSLLVPFKEAGSVVLPSEINESKIWKFKWDNDELDRIHSEHLDRKYNSANKAKQSNP